jgi:hypothetical protein
MIRPQSQQLSEILSNTEVNFIVNLRSDKVDRPSVKFSHGSFVIFSCTALYIVLILHIVITINHLFNWGICKIFHEFPN